MHVATTCPYCSADLAPEDRYCSGCGSRLVPASQATSEPRQAPPTGAPLPSSLTPPPPTPSSAPRKGMPTWLKVLLGAIAAFIILLVVGGFMLVRWANNLSIEANSSVPAIAAVGDCVATHDGEPTVVACAEPHEYEIYHAFEWPGTDEYPGWDGAWDTGWQPCEAAFEDFVDNDYWTSDFDYEVIAPPEELWNAGDRRIRCALYDLIDPTIVGTAEGARR